MCCVIEVWGDDGEGVTVELECFYARIRTETGDLLAGGHYAEPGSLMLIVKQAVGFALNETRSGRKGVFIKQLADPCDMHIVKEPFDLSGFCLKALHYMDVHPTEATGYDGKDQVGE